MCKTRLNCCLFWLLLLPGVATAQLTTMESPKKSVDELKKLLQKSKPDANRVEVLLKLGDYYLYKPEELMVDLDSALLFLQEAKTLSETLHAEKQIEESLVLMSKCYFERQEILSGRAVFMQLIQKYQKEGNKAKMAAAYMKMAREMFRNDNTYEEIISYFQKAGLLYEQIEDKENSIMTLKEIADIHLNQGKLDQSEQELLQVIKEYKAIGFKNLHYTYDLLAAVYTVKGNYNWALYFGLETVKNMEVTGDSIYAFTFYLRLGAIYSELRQIEKSMKWYRKAMEKSENIKFGLINYIIDDIIRLGKPAEALDFIKSALKKQAPATDHEKSRVARMLGNCYHALGQDELAEKYYLEMIEKEKLTHQQNGYTCVTNLTIAEFYVNRHQYYNAISYLNKILALPAVAVLPNKMKDAQLLLFKVDSAAGNYLSAIQHFQMHKTLNDSLFNETKSQQIEELQIQYETEQKEKDIQLLQNESTLQQSRLAQANLAKNITFGGITLLLIIVSLLYNRYRLKQRSNRQLEIQQIEINQTNRSLQKLLEEKEWLLREIHHRVKNNLQIVMSLLNTQSVYLVNDAALSAIRDSQHRIRSISLIHQKLYQSQNIASINMPTYIQELVEYLQDSFDTNYNIHFDLNIEPVELDVTQAVPLGLILNEAISNAIKYAFPNRKGLINITMQQVDEENYSLIIADNGVGLPPDFDVNKSNSLGMSLMKGLSKQLNGRFELRNENGLTIHIAFANEVISKPFIKLNEMQLSA